MWTLRLLLFYFLRDSDNVDISPARTRTLNAPTVSVSIIAYSVLLPRFDQRGCFSRANFIAGPPSSAQSHRPLRFAPRRRHARRIGLAMAECAAGSFSGPALEEDDGGGSQKKTQVVSLNWSLSCLAGERAVKFGDVLSGRNWGFRWFACWNGPLPVCLGTVQLNSLISCGGILVNRK